MTRATLFLLLAALLGGCISNENPSAAAPKEPNDRAPGQVTSPTPAEVAAEEPPPEPIIERVAWDGEAPSFQQACVFVADFSCLVAVGSLFTLYELPAANWTHAILNLTWSSMVPGHAMGVGIYGCSPGCEEGEGMSEYVVGTSPLTLDVPIRPARPEYPVITIAVWSEVAVDQGPVYMLLNPKQPFHLEGAVHGVREVDGP